MNVSEYIVKFIESKQIDFVYAVVGGASLWLDKALSEAQSLKTIFTNHEQAATMAADGYARISGKAGYVFTINGPGVTNTVTGIAQAWVDSSPVILISGNSNSESVKFERDHNMRQYGTQDIRSDLILKPITKKTYFVKDANDIADIMADAYKTATSGRPGPVFIEIPINIQSSDIEDDGFEPELISPAPHNIHDKIYQIVDAIKQAKRPLILAGQGIRLSNSVVPFQQFYTKFHIPVVTTRMGIDVIPSDSPYFVGRPGNHGSRPSHFALQTCDLLLILGARLAPNTTGYNVSGFSPQSRKILVEIDKNELKKKDIQIDVILNEDLHAFFSEMNDLFTEIPDHKEWMNKCIRWRTRYPIMQPEYAQMQNISTYTVVDEMSKIAQDNDVILSDTGSCCSIVAQVWQIKKHQRLFISGGLSSMGYWVTSMGIGLAAHNEQKVIVFAGDGSLQMNIHELATIQKYQIPVKLIVISNDGYQFVRMSQSSYNFKHTFGTSVSEGLPLPNIQNVVEAYGIKYISCSDKNNLVQILQQTYQEDEPVVCEIFVDTNQEVCPRIKSVADEKGKFHAPAYENLYPFLDDAKLKSEMNLCE